jgi:hypothetical protein
MIDIRWDVRTKKIKNGYIKHIREYLIEEDPSLDISS